MAYATVDDLAGYVTTVPDDAALRLDRATRLVDKALLCAVYDVDDADIQTTLRAATCEQVAAWIGVGEDGTGTSDQYGTVSIGSVTLGGKRTAAGGPAAQTLAEQAHLALELAGLLGQSPYTYPTCP